MVSLYQVRNEANGKMYFGKTHKAILARWAEHLKFARAGKPWALSRAIRKYGADSFSIAPLFTVATQEEANHWEASLITHHKTNKPEFGYNMTSGGEGNCNPAPETRKRMGASQRARIARGEAAGVHTRFRFGKMNARYRSTADTGRIIALYLSGLGLRGVAKLVGLSDSGVARRLRQAGVALRTGWKPGRPCAEM